MAFLFVQTTAAVAVGSSSLCRRQSCHWLGTFRPHGHSFQTGPAAAEYRAVLADADQSLPHSAATGSAHFGSLPDSADSRLRFTAEPLPDHTQQSHACCCHCDVLAGSRSSHPAGWQQTGLRCAWILQQSHGLFRASGSTTDGACCSAGRRLFTQTHAAGFPACGCSACGPVLRCQLFRGRQFQALLRHLWIRDLSLHPQRNPQLLDGTPGSGCQPGIIACLSVSLPAGTSRTAVAHAHPAAVSGRLWPCLHAAVSGRAATAMSHSVSCCSTASGCHRTADIRRGSHHSGYTQLLPDSYRKLQLRWQQCGFALDAVAVAVLVAGHGPCAQTFRTPDVRTGRGTAAGLHADHSMVHAATLETFVAV